MAKRSPAKRIAYLTFAIGRDAYALPLERVGEVVSCEAIAPVPAAPPFVKGLVNVGGAPVPVLDLASRFGAGADGTTANQSVVVVRVSLGARLVRVGILADRLGRILRVAVDRVRSDIPFDSLISVPFLAGAIEEDGRFILPINVDRLLNADEAASAAALAAESAAAPAASPTEQLPYLLVRVGGERCAIPLSSLRETTACDLLARIPGTPDYVLGATSVRGSIVAVIDLGTRCGLKPTPRLPESRLVLAGVWIDGREVPVALLVDRIEGLVGLSPNDIRRTPPFGTRLPSELVEGMAPTGEQFAPILATSRALSPYEGERASTAPAPSVPSRETEDDSPAQKAAASPRARRRKSAGR